MQAAIEQKLPRLQDFAIGGSLLTEAQTHAHTKQYTNHFLLLRRARDRNERKEVSNPLNMLLRFSASATAVNLLRSGLIDNLTRVISYQPTRS